MIGMVAMTACIFVLFFAQNLTMILVGNLLAGIPWGIFQAQHTSSKPPCAADRCRSLPPHMPPKWCHRH
jgi:predicted MFS family arabinose efflux permease